MKIRIHIIFVLSLFYLFSCQTTESEIADFKFLEKQKGVHLFGGVDSTNATLFLKNNIEWITLVPWGFQDDIDSPKVGHHNGDSLHIKEGNSNWINSIQKARSAGFKVFVKPHIWLNNPSDGKWRSDIFPSNDKNWETWKASYQDFILRYAKLAQAAKAEMFCVGTELSRITVEKPLFWKELIQEIRQVYKGKITLAANWYKEYEDITFWDDLDYIGIQAYFPLTKQENPSVQQISKGWRSYTPTMESIVNKFKRKIIFTEMGYKSTSDSAISPWEWMDNPHSQDKVFSLKTQANCYEAFFKTIWKKDWFAGVHIWQMRSDYEADYLKNNRDFTPQGKPAEKIIAKGFQ